MLEAALCGGGPERAQRRLPARLLVRHLRALGASFGDGGGARGRRRPRTAIVPGVRAFVETRGRGRLAARGADAASLGGAGAGRGRRSRRSRPPRALGVAGGGRAAGPRRAARSGCSLAEVPARRPLPRRRDRPARAARAGAAQRRARTTASRCTSARRVVRLRRGSPLVETPQGRVRAPRGRRRDQRRRRGLAAARPAADELRLLRRPDGAGAGAARARSAGRAASRSSTRACSCTTSARRTTAAS